MEFGNFDWSYHPSSRTNALTINFQKSKNTVFKISKNQNFVKNPKFPKNPKSNEKHPKTTSQKIKTTQKNSYYRFLIGFTGLQEAIESTDQQIASMIPFVSEEEVADIHELEILIFVLNKFWLFNFV